jgi:hypothetical protein
VKLIKIAAIFLFLFLITNTAFADSMRCGRRLVRSGDPKIKVLMTCGEPILKEVVGERTVRRRYRGGREWITLKIEKWTYDLGFNEFLHILTFEGDRLVDVERAGRPSDFR